MNHAGLVRWTLIVLVSHGLTAHAASFSDNFESPTSTATFWVETGDNDPGAPWIVIEADARPFNLQLVRHPQTLPNPPYSFGPPPDGGLQYMHTIAQINETTQGWVPVTVGDGLELSVEVFGFSGFDSWRTDLRVAGYNSAVTNGTNPAFDVHLRDGGYGVDGTVQYVDGTGTHTVPGLVFKVNTWQKLRINADFNTDTFSITLDGNTATNLTWAGGNLSQIQSVMLGVDNSNIVFNRGGFDNFSIIPEPSAVALLGLSGLVLWRRRSQ